jgi:hypothetical protein
LPMGNERARVESVSLISTGVGELGSESSCAGTVTSERRTKADALITRSKACGLKLNIPIPPVRQLLFFVYL